MARTIKPIYVVFIPTVIFLLFFPALHFYYTFYVSDYFDGSVYTWYSFPGGKVPSIRIFFFACIHSLYSWIVCVLIAYLFSQLSRILIYEHFIKMHWLNVLFVAINLTILLGIVYFIYLFFLYSINNGTNNFFFLSMINSQVKLLAGLYFFIILPVVFVVNKKNN
jgi:hypothetical protein